MSTQRCSDNPIATAIAVAESLASTLPYDSTKEEEVKKRAALVGELAHAILLKSSTIAFNFKISTQ